MAKGWRLEGARHRLSALRISTGRKQRGKKGIINTGTNSMFFLKKDTKDITMDLPIKAIKTAAEVAGQKGRK
jgi:hypothetical protein